jgi:hypothetical protein
MSRRKYAINLIESEHGRLKARLRPMRGLKRLASARTIAAGHAFVQNLRRGHYAITADLPVRDRLRVAFDELALSLTDPQLAMSPGSAPSLCINATAPVRVRTCRPLLR